MNYFTKETKDGYEWEDWVFEIKEQDPEEIDNTKLNFIGDCEKFCGINYGNIINIVADAYQRPIIYRIKLFFLKLLIIKKPKF